MSCVRTLAQVRQKKLTNGATFQKDSGPRRRGKATRHASSTGPYIGERAVVCTLYLRTARSRLGDKWSTVLTAVIVTMAMVTMALLADDDEDDDDDTVPDDSPGCMSGQIALSHHHAGGPHWPRAQSAQHLDILGTTRVRRLRTGTVL